MDDLTLRKTVAENLTYYRRKQGLTQAALAETLNYSDKSISKWERGEGLPDLSVLVKLAEYYNITVNDLVLPRTEEELAAEQAPEEEAPKGVSRRTKILVPAMSIGLVWLVAMICFLIFRLIVPGIGPDWLVFVYALPASCIVATVFAALWWKQPFTFLSVSGIIWSVALSLYCTIPLPSIGLIFAVAAVLQVLNILFCIQVKK